MTLPYHAFTQKHPGLTNRIITPIHVSAAFDPKNPPANPKFFSTSALWDTGATQSVVTEATAKTLGLVETGKSLVHFAKGHGQCSTYMVNFLLPNQVGIQGVRAHRHKLNRSRQDTKEPVSVGNSASLKWYLPSRINLRNIFRRLLLN